MHLLKFLIYCSWMMFFCFFSKAGTSCPCFFTTFNENAITIRSPAKPSNRLSSLGGTEGFRVFLISDGCYLLVLKILFLVGEVDSHSEPLDPSLCAALLCGLLHLGKADCLNLLNWLYSICFISFKRYAIALLHCR
jgi:hypothetical protein